MTKIKNINGTSDNICKCGSWLRHWERFSDRPATYCGEGRCTEKATIGSHVQKADSTDNDWYIIPLCELHNACKEELEVASILVPANRKETCEK